MSFLHCPIVSSKTLEVSKALLNSGFRKELEAEYGKLLFDILENEVKSVDEKIIPLMQEENTLCAEFDRLTASAQIPFQGGVYTL